MPDEQTFMPDEQTFTAEMQVEATAYAVHPEGAQVPAAEPADESAPTQENDK